MSRVLQMREMTERGTWVYHVYGTVGSEIFKVFEGPRHLYGEKDSKGEYDHVYDLTINYGKIVEAVPVNHDRPDIPFLYHLYKIYGTMPRFISRRAEMDWIRKASPLDFFFFHELNPFGRSLKPSDMTGLCDNWRKTHCSHVPGYTASGVEKTVVGHVLSHLVQDLRYGHSFSLEHKIPSHLLLAPALALMVEKKYVIVEMGRVILTDVRVHEENLARCLGEIKKRWSACSGVLETVSKDTVVEKRKRCGDDARKDRKIKKRRLSDACDGPGAVFEKTAGAERSGEEDQGDEEHDEEDQEEDEEDQDEEEEEEEEIRIKMVPEQEAALQLCETKSMSGIFGGAGSGKTSILKYYIEKHPNTLTFTPTNMARRAFLERVPGGECYTLHSFIHRVSQSDDSDDLSEFLKKVRNTQTAIIDETSLLGATVTSIFLHCLVEACPQLVNIIFVGDPNQLPSVEHGNVIKDLMVLIPRTELKLCHRVTTESLVIFENVKKILFKNTRLDYQPCFQVREAPAGSSEAGELITRVLEENKDATPWTSHIIAMTRDHVGQLNQACAKFYNERKDPRSRGLCVGDKVMCLVNYTGDEADSFSNGEIFRLEVIDRYEDSTSNVSVSMPSTDNFPSKGYFVLTFSCPRMSGDSSPATWPRKQVKTSTLSLSSFTLGYATTVHKFQGSETDTIFFYSPPPAKKHAFRASCSPAALYTAVTRAKKKVVVVSTEEEVSSIIKQRDDVRRSLLADQVRRLVNDGGQGKLSNQQFKRMKSSMFSFM